MILIKIKKSCHESCHEIARPLISQGFWNLVLWVQVPSPGDRFKFCVNVKN